MSGIKKNKSKIQIPSVFGILILLFVSCIVILLSITSQEAFKYDASAYPLDQYSCTYNGKIYPQDVCGCEVGLVPKQYELCVQGKWEVRESCKLRCPLPTAVLPTGFCNDLDDVPDYGCADKKIGDICPAGPTGYLCLPKVFDGNKFYCGCVAPKNITPTLRPTPTGRYNCNLGSRSQNQNEIGCENKFSGDSCTNQANPGKVGQCTLLPDLSVWRCICSNMKFSTTVNRY